MSNIPLKFYLKTIVIFFITICFSIFLISCIEDTFPADINDLHLDLLDTATVDIEFTPYQIPPDIGSNHYLYVGSNSNFTVSRTVLKLGNLTALQDSTFEIIDSRIVLTLIDTVLEIQPSFILSYFAMDSTIEFSESGTNYDNDDWLDEIVFDGQFIADSLSLDTSGIYTVEFPIDTSVVMAWADTSADPQLLVLESPALNSEVLQFYSTENGSLEPALIVSYSDSVTVTVTIDSMEVDTLILDTLELVLEMSSDVSIVEPPLFSGDEFKSTLIYFSNGAGMKALMNYDFSWSDFVDLNSLNVPEEAVILKANLILHSDLTNSIWEEDGTFKMKIAALEDTIVNEGDYLWPAFIPEDSLGTGVFKVSMLDSVTMKMNHKIDRLVEPIFLGVEDNLGFKLETSSTPSIFNIIAFYTSENSDSLHPRLEIYYGVP